MRSVSANNIPLSKAATGYCSYFFRYSVLHGHSTDPAQLMEEDENAQMEQTELGRFHEFSVGVRVGAQLMIEMLKEL